MGGHVYIWKCVCCCAPLLTLVLGLSLRSLSQPIRSCTTVEEVEWAQGVQSPRREIQPRVEKPRNNTHWMAPPPPTSSLPKFPVLTPLFLYLPSFFPSPNGCKAKQYPGLKSFSLSLSLFIFFPHVTLQMCVYIWDGVCERRLCLLRSLCWFFHTSFPPPPPLIAPISPPVSLSGSLWRSRRVNAPPGSGEDRDRQRGQRGVGREVRVKPPHCLCPCVVSNTELAHPALVREPVWVKCDTCVYTHTQTHTRRENGCAEKAWGRETVTGA